MSSSRTSSIHIASLLEITSFFSRSAVGDSRIGLNPRTRIRKNSRTREQGISKSVYFSSKDVSPFTRAPRPPFIGRGEEFYILILPSDLKNIPKWEHVHECLLHPVIRGVNLLSLYFSVKRSHHVRREGLENPTLIQKREEYTPLDFMKI
jgi:hypothetical protein